MTPFAHQIIRWAAIAALIAMVVASAGLLGQTLALLFGGAESPALIAALGTLAGAALTTLAALAGIVWSRERNGKE